MSDPFLFRRVGMADEMVRSLLGETMFDLRSGVFLAAPRRTGKTTFLRYDFVPALVLRDILPVYVDLWSDRKADPSALVMDAVRNAVRNGEPTALKYVRAMGLEKFKLGGLSFDLSRANALVGDTLMATLASLVETSSKKVALIIDEAQTLLNTDDGRNCLFALKAARDALLGDMMLVCTGSYRDKLVYMTMDREQAFYGAAVRDMPVLDRKFTDAYTAWLNDKLKGEDHLNPEEVFVAFEILGHEPEALKEAVHEYVFSRDLPLTEVAMARRASAWQQYDTQFDGLSSVKQAVLIKIIEDGERSSPFSTQSLQSYADYVGETVSTSSVQTALEGLRSEGLVWKSFRGNYLPEHTDLRDWLKCRRERELLIPPPVDVVAIEDNSTTEPEGHVVDKGCGL